MDHALIVRSPFRAKHHVACSAVHGKVAEMSPAPQPPPQPPTPEPPCPQTPLRTPHPYTDSMTGGGQGRIDEQGRIDDITGARDFALQLP